MIRFTLDDEEVYYLIPPEVREDLSRFTEHVILPKNVKCLIRLP